MTTTRTLPNGFELKSVETEASGVKYALEVRQATSLEAILEAYAAEGKNGDEVLLGIWNAANEQSAKQQKGTVRAAIEEHGADSEKVQEAISGHQERAPGFMIGAPRGGGGKKHETGLTAKQREALGTAVALEMVKTGGVTKARMDEIARELGIDPAGLHQD